MKRLFIATIPLLLVACASPSTTSDAEPEQKVYRTGSNLPVRDPEASSTTKTMDTSKMQTQPVPSLNPRPGGG